MLDAGSAGGYAYPAVNVASQTLNAALRGFAEAGSDGIVQVTTGGASYLSGTGDDAGGARAFALFAHVVADYAGVLRVDGGVGRRAPTTRGPGAARARPRWPPGCRRRASSSARPARACCSSGA